MVVLEDLEVADSPMASLEGVEEVVVRFPKACLELYTVNY